MDLASPPPLHFGSCCLLERTRPQLLFLLLADWPVCHHNFEQRLLKMAERRLPGETDTSNEVHYCLAFFARHSEMSCVSQNQRHQGRTLHRTCELCYRTAHARAQNLHNTTGWRPTVPLSAQDELLCRASQIEQGSGAAHRSTSKREDSLLISKYAYFLENVQVLHTH